jgi:AraC-like DNA-binding protein
MVLMAPLVIFIESKLLAVFSIVFFFGIFYMVDSFSNYIVSSGPKRMQEAEESAIENENGGVTDNGSEAEHQKQETSNRSSIFDETDAFRIESAVNEWINDGGYRQAGLKLPNAADAIDVPQYQLSAWLRQQGLTYASWINSLRIEEAKRTLCEHPDWNNEAVAQHCGFNDRSYFQMVFKKETGLTPSDFHEAQNL